MTIDAANIWQDFNTQSRTEQGTLDDNSNQVLLGPHLNDAVRHWATGYLRDLDLGPEHKAMDERAKLLDLHWGHLEHDGAMLRGLGVAMTNFAQVLGDNVGELGKSWKGDSFNAFKAAMDKVQRTVAEYGVAATTTGEGLVNAMGQIRELCRTFADDSAHKHLQFRPTSPPERWHKVSVASEDKKEKPFTVLQMSLDCPTHGGVFACLKADGELSKIITGKFVTENRWDICRQDPCEGEPERVSTMYRYMVDECDKAIDRIKGKLDNYFAAVTTTVDGVSDLYGAALSNVHHLAQASVFTTLRVIGAGAPADTPVDTGGAPVDTGSYPVSDPGPASATEPPQPEPPQPEPVVEETAPEAVAVQEPPPGTVQIQDGDRTIGVTSPDGEGRVTVTVADGAGVTKTYELDFDAASGMSATRPEGAGEGAVEQIPARTDGKCVIQDGQLTITAERPLFSPDSIKLVVDDGSGNPTTYTLDFDGEDAAGQQPPAATPTEADSAPAANAPASADAASGAPPTGAAPAEAAPADSALASIDAANGVTAPRPDAAPAEAVTRGATPADSAPADVPASADAASGVTATRRDAVPVEAVAGGATASGPAPAVNVPASADAASGVTAPRPDAVPVEAVAGGEPAPAADVPDPDAPAATSGTTPGGAGSVNGASTEPTPTAVDPEHRTYPQAWHEEQSGSVSGVLIPDQPGEAGLAKAPDADQPEVAGMAGTGLPMLGAPAAGGGHDGGHDGGRAGSGWSVHGDLFDNNEPVYSMHGVLGADDDAKD
jgi:uncharacterized protein YukE